MRSRFAARRKSSLLLKIIRFVWQAGSGLVLLLLFGFGYRQVEGLWRSPQAVLVLGGATEREQFAAEFAKQHPELPVWVSSGSNPEYAEWLFNESGIAPDRIHLDYQAVDTVTNFTSLADYFKTRDIRSVYLITSDYHMRRAQVIGEIVLGSRGIDFQAVSVPSGKSPEPLNKVVRDAARSVLWVMTGETGSQLSRRHRQ
ncbi:MAG: YdcF family protein [Pegethrix bostrychoides GSE-TBD4-15B]|uniref:YdcF family protein n=1 Tax=Pegethrix bostrychoides GSE-TBD4-15B TaxID=2839662 RepID=A0A951PCJ4_9CYAN|nr:YdcF family protein [Pegethrix bostrychoides GSE-TBD4-15B]